MFAVCKASRVTNHTDHKPLNPLCYILELFSDKSNTHEFVDLVKELALPGELTQNRSYDFEFMQVEKPYESYTGANVRLRYANNTKQNAGPISVVTNIQVSLTAANSLQCVDLWQ